MSMTDYAIIHEGLYAFGVQGTAPSRFLSVRGFATELGCCGVDRRTTGERGCGRIDTAQFGSGPAWARNAAGSDGSPLLPSLLIAPWRW